MNRVAMYLRCSTEDQDLRVQQELISEFAKARGWQIVATYQDKLSGTTSNRPQFKAMLKDARARKFDILCVLKIDRLARSLRDLLDTLNLLNELGITFVSIRDQFDGSTSSGRLMLSVVGAVAEFEASLIRERTKLAMDSARRRGIHCGRPRVRDDAQIRRLRAQGLTVREIAKRIGLSTGPVMRALKAA